MATVVGTKEGCRTPGQKAREKGRTRMRGRSAGKKQKARGSLRKGCNATEGGARGRVTGRPRGIKAGRGAERQQAKKDQRGARSQAAVPDGAGARMEQPAGGHEWGRGVHLGLEDTDDSVSRWDTDSF